MPLSLVVCSELTAAASVGMDEQYQVLMTAPSTDEQHPVLMSSTQY